MKKYLSILLLTLNILYPRECLIQHDPDERPTRPEKDTYAISPSGHFYIHYDTTGNAAPDLADSDANGIPDYVDEVSVIADSAHHVLVDVLGYNEETFDGEGGYDIYIMSYSAGVYGINFSEGNGMSYIHIDNDYIGYNSIFNLTPLQIMRISLGHEYFHGIQWGYEHNLGSNAYFYEMSAMWFEDVLIPDGNDYLDGWADDLLDDPTADFDNTGSGYELALFGHYLSSFLDPKGIDTAKNSTIIREMWERFGDTNSSALSAAEYVLDGENYSLTFIEAWTDFISRNLYNGMYENINNPFYYYGDQALIDPITTNPVLLGDSQDFVLDLDNKSVAIQSYQLGELNALLDINHSADEYLGRIFIVSPRYPDLIWATDTSGIELVGESEIHFVYGSISMGSVSINLTSTPDTNFNNDATEASIFVYPNEVTFLADGFIGGVEMTLVHDNEFSIDMTDMALFADYLTTGNETHLLVIYPETNLLFSYIGYFEITEVIVANSQYEVSTEIYYFNYNPGDVNGDGELNILDVVTLVDIIMSNGNYISAGDINGDGYLNIMDVVQLVNMVLEF